MGVRLEWIPFQNFINQNKMELQKVLLPTKFAKYRQKCEKMSDFERNVRDGKNLHELPFWIF